MSISISLVLQKRNITMKKKSSSALSNHKIVLFFTHHDFLFHFFLSYFCHLEAIYLGIEEVRLKFNQKKSIQVHKATAWFFFLTHKYKIGPCHLPDFSKIAFQNNWLMWLWVLLWIFLNLPSIKWFWSFFVKIKPFYGIFEASISRTFTTGSNYFKSYFDNP